MESLRATTPVMILVFARTIADYSIEKDLIGIGVCLQNMMLTATVMGYGSCVIGDLYGHNKMIAAEIALDMSDCILVCGLVVGKQK